MSNFGVPRRPVPMTPPPRLNLRRGLFRLWLLLTVGWIMGWTIYLLMEGIQGNLSTTRDFLNVAVLLFGPPVALWIFGKATAWAIRGFEETDEPSANS
jgi:hypothetical protein